MGWEANSCRPSTPLVLARTLQPLSSSSVFRPSSPFHSSSTHRIRGLFGMAILGFVGRQAREDLPLAPFPKAAPLREQWHESCQPAKDGGAQLKSNRSLGV